VSAALRQCLIEWFDGAAAGGGDRTRDGRWTYRRPEGVTGPEYASWHGPTSPVSNPHFHDEVQATWVLSGRRRFAVGAHRIDIAAGQCLVIPPRMPHASLVLPEGETRSRHVYLGAGMLPVDVTTPLLIDLADTDDVTPFSALDANDNRDVESLARRMDGSSTPVSAVIAAMGLSRAALTRKFARHVGMPPHAYRLASRLNCARQMLKQGDAIADAAAAAGFADQSHLGRLFRRCFGTTPASYRRA
jgi:AraC-like DNA-binding protein